MKKLLSILASLTIAGSGASAVVACSLPTRTVPTDGQYDPDDSNSDSAANIHGGDAADPTKGRDNNNNKGSHSNNVKPNRHDENNPVDLQTVKDEMNKIAQSAVLQNQYGINEKYLKNNLKMNAYDSVSGINHNGNYGSEANPLINFLQAAGILDQSAVDTINQILPLVNNVDTPTPTQLGGTIAQVVKLAGPLGSVISGLIKDEDVPGIKEKAESIFTPTNKAIIDDFIASDNKLDSKYDSLTLGDSLKSFVIGAARILALGTKDTDASTQEFSDLTKVANSDKAVDYIVKRAIALISSSKSDTPITFDINNLAGTDGISVFADMLKIIGMYMEAFDQYQYTSILGIDSNHVFKENDKTPLKNFDVINKVRNQTVGSQKYQFDIFKLIADVSYYLGTIDKQEGVYKLQALLAMFLVDEDKSDVSQFVLSWDNNYGSGHAYKESENRTPIMSLLNKFIRGFLSANEPDGYDKTVSNIPIIGSKIKWPAIVEIARHNVYMVLQSMAWNKGFSMSDEKLVGLLPMNVVDKGFAELPFALQALRLYMNFPGLNVLDEWKNIEDKGFLSYLFTGNIYEFITEVKNNPEMKKFYRDLSKDIMPHKDPDKDGKGGKDSASEAVEKGATDLLNKVKPFTSEVPNSEKISFKGNIGDYKKVVFNSNGMQTVLNTDLSQTKPSSGDWIKYGKTFPKAYPEPSIVNVISGGYDSVSNTTKLIIKANNIYNGNGHYPKDLANTLMINGKALSDVVTSDFDNSSYSVSVTYTGTAQGKVTSDMVVTGDAWDCTGYNDHDHTIHIPIVGDQWVGAWEYDHKEIRNSVINIGWQQDDLQIANKFNFDFSNDSWKNISSMKLTMAEIQRLSGLTITGYKDDSDKGTNIIDKIDPTMGPSVNMQSVAALTITKLLGALGVKGFINNDSPLGPLPVADNYSIGSAILELGNLIKEPSTYDALKNIIDSDSFSYGHFQQLVNVIFGNETKDVTVDGKAKTVYGDNIVDLILDAIKNTGKYAGGNLADNLNDVFGLERPNVYTANKLIGTLISTFTDGMKPQNEGVVRGTTGKTTLWSYLLDTKGGVIRKTWDFLNSWNNNDLINKLADLKNFDIQYADDEKDGKATKVVGTVKYTYAYDAYIDGGQVKAKTVDSTFTITWIANNDKGTYSISKN